MKSVMDRNVSRRVLQRLEMTDDGMPKLRANRRVTLVISNEFDKFLQSQYGERRLVELEPGLWVHEHKQRVNVRHLALPLRN
jgi:hypothetical protein